jgi:hypothetical protein
VFPVELSARREARVVRQDEGVRGVDGPLPSRFAASGEGSKAVLPPLAIVWRCVLDIEAYAAAGRDVVVPRQDCPDCRVPMIFWSGYERRVRHVGRVWVIWVRRGKCNRCGGRTHALLPAFELIGRRHDVEVIGIAVTAVVWGVSVSAAARAAGVARSTVRSWCRRHQERARRALAMVVAVTAAVGMGWSPPVRAECGGCRPWPVWPRARWGVCRFGRRCRW